MVKRKNSHKHLFFGILIVLIVVVSIYSYYRYTQYHPSTDDAYISANTINIKPKVGGYIQKIYVENNQFVHKGDLLLDLDPIDISLQLNKAQKDDVFAQQQADTAKQQIATAKSSVDKAKSDYDFAHKMEIRYTGLYQQKAGSMQDMQKCINQATQAKQALDQANIAFEQAKTQYSAALTQIAISRTQVENWQNNTGYTQLRAPVDGYVSNFKKQVGELIAVGEAVMVIVDDSSWWVDANYKETQLKHIKAGQTATIELDMYDHKYTGVVQSISHASGNTFSLLPAENATGNWVKVIQRFTVKVKLDSDKDFPLRVGASSNIIIDASK